MAIRTFVFCDVCNPQGIRYVEQRRSGNRDGTIGRRVTDGRAWREGGVSEAEQGGWAMDRTSRHVCPRCQSRNLHEQ